MGPEEEFELHNRQNSWPILFEVFCFHGSVIPAGTLLYPQDAWDCNVRWRTTNKQSEPYMMPLPITAERLSAGDEPAICVMTFLSQSLLVNDRAVCCRLDDRSTFPWSAANNDGSGPPRLTDRPSANNNSGEGWWRLSKYANTGRHSVKIESWSQPGIGSLRFPGHKYLYIIELTVCNVLIVYVCCLGASEFVV